MEQIRFNISKIISFVVIKSEANQAIEEQQNSRIKEKKIPRNSRCPCGSGKKYKHCHGKI